MLFQERPYEVKREGQVFADINAASSKLHYTHYEKYTIDPLRNLITGF